MPPGGARSKEPGASTYQLKEHLARTQAGTGPSKPLCYSSCKELNQNTGFKRLSLDGTWFKGRSVWNRNYEPVLGASTNNEKNFDCRRRGGKVKTEVHSQGVQTCNGKMSREQETRAVGVGP